MQTPKVVLDFWFEELNPEQWFKKDSDLDIEIANRFISLLGYAKKGECFKWRKTPKGRLAEIILLDQFSRNIYRESPRAFEADNLALILAQEAHELDIRADLEEKQVPFLYMPFMHSESQVIHEVAEHHFRNISELKNHLEYELKYKVIVDRFGRYPHRNKVLGRQSTPEEEEFLSKPGSSF